MQGPALSTCDRCSCIVLQTRLISHYGRRPGHLSCFALRFVQGHEEETEPTTALFPGSKTPERCDAVALGSSISVAAPFRSAVPYWFDHGPVFTPRSSNRTGRFVG